MPVFPDQIFKKNAATCYFLSLTKTLQLKVKERYIRQIITKKKAGICISILYIIDL